MSVDGSVPTTVASAVLPSEKVTMISPPLPAPSTTWLLVRMWPCSSITTPDPSPEPPGPDTLSETTLGVTCSATAVTDWASGAGALPVTVRTVDTGWLSAARYPVTPPAAAPTSPAAAATASTSATPRIGLRSLPGVGAPLPGGAGGGPHGSVGAVAGGAPQPRGRVGCGGWFASGFGCQLGSGLGPYAGREGKVGVSVMAYRLGPRPESRLIRCSEPGEK